MPSQIDTLTSLRFFAATSIVVHHLEGVLWIPAHALQEYKLGAGVSFFFVLSGFVLYHSYRERVWKIGLARFAALRFFRIWPAHVAVLALGIFWLQSQGFAWQLERLNNFQIAEIVLLMQSWSSDFFVF